MIQTHMFCLQGPAPAVNHFCNKLLNDGEKPLVHDSLRVILSTEDIDGYLITLPSELFHFAAFLASLCA